LSLVSQKYSIDDSVSGFLRLTDQGTSFFERLLPEKKTGFIQNLTSQLAGIIPVQSNRIKSNYRYQKDTKSRNQMLINIQILKPNNDSELSVTTIVSNLSTLVKNKVFNSLSLNSLTSMLDSTYGFQKYSKDNNLYASIFC
jgi:hypothetical protein